MASRRPFVWNNLMTTTPSYTSAQLERFFSMAAGKGLINKNTALSLRSAATKVLGVLESHEKEDLRNLDRELAFKRFQNLKGMDYSPESLTTYKSRFGAAVDEFLRYTSDPAAYRPTSRKKSANPADLSKDRPQKRSLRKPDITQQNRPQSDANLSPEIQQPAYKGALMIPIPIRLGVSVQIFGIPPDLSPEEAKKISAVVLAYATH
jgi:hypothetical protein